MNTPIDKDTVAFCEACGEALVGTDASFCGTCGARTSIGRSRRFATPGWILLGIAISITASAVLVTTWMSDSESPSVSTTQDVDTESELANDKDPFLEDCLDKFNEDPRGWNKRPLADWKSRGFDVYASVGRNARYPDQCLIYVSAPERDQFRVFTEEAGDFRNRHNAPHDDYPEWNAQVGWDGSLSLK